MKPLTLNILSAVWMENSFPQRGRKQRETSPATVRSRVPTTNLLTTRCVSWLWWVTLPLGLLPAATRLFGGWQGVSGPGAAMGVNKLLQSRLTACVLNRLPLCAAGLHHLCLASKLGNRRRQSTISSPKAVFMNSLITHPDNTSRQQLTPPQETENGQGRGCQQCHFSSRQRSTFCPCLLSDPGRNLRLARGPVPLRRGNGSRATKRRGKWGFHRGSRHVPTQPGDCVCSEMSPCGQDASAGVCLLPFLLLRGVPPWCLCALLGVPPTPGILLPPRLAASCPWCVGTHRVGPSGAVERQFLAAGGWQQLLCIMESYLPAQKAVPDGFFSLVLSSPSLCLCWGRKNWDDVSGGVTQQVLCSRELWGEGGGEPTSSFFCFVSLLELSPEGLSPGWPKAACSSVLIFLPAGCGSLPCPYFGEASVGVGTTYESTSGALQGAAL